jgi:hypothetical protein
MSQNEKLRIIFLDIDGVMNSFGEERIAKHQKATTFAQMWCPTPEAVSNLLDIANAYDNVEVVISSTWRMHCKGPHVWECLFYAIGGYDRPIRMHWGKDTITPRSIDGYRGREIQEWLDKHGENVESFVIIDDGADMEPYMNRAVVVNGEVGLTKEDAMKAIEILGRSWV